MDYIADAIPRILEREKSDEVFTQSEIDEMYVKFNEIPKPEIDYYGSETIAGRIVAMALIVHKIDPSTIEGKPLEEKLIKEEFEYGFMGKHEKCRKCDSEMLGRIHSYPPYCDSTYEEWSCPVCGKGGWGSSI
jgi:hypothetical protein